MVTITSTEFVSVSPWGGSVVIIVSFVPSEGQPIERPIYINDAKDLEPDRLAEIIDRESANLAVYLNTVPGSEV